MSPIADLRYPMSRRRLIRSFGASAAAMFLPRSTQAFAQPAFSASPFRLGIAAGDPAPDGFVIWTRLAPDPLTQGYGMAPVPVEVAFEVAADEGFADVVRRGSAVARPELGHSVHVEVAGLQPARPYWYRFAAGGQRSPAGRARTAPAIGAAVGTLRFGVAGCQHYEAGLFTAHRMLAAEELDFIFCYGDYIYEYSSATGTRAGPNGQQAPIPRRHVGGLTYSLDDYRRRYAQYKMDPDLQAAHASAAWFCVWDDHEIEDNWTSTIDRSNTPAEVFALRRQAAAQAYYEHTPLRASAFPVGPAIQVYRNAPWGQLADFNFLDTRQYRTDQPCGDRWEGCRDTDEPAAEVIGAAQEAWLLQRLSASKARWNVLAQQIMMMDLDRTIGEATPRLNTDSWAGYRIPRGRLLSQMRDRRIANPIVLTGDEHVNYAGELHLDDRRPDPRPIGIEFVGTSISSGGDGADQAPDQARILANNPPLKFMNAQRGYLVCDVTAERWQTEFRVIDQISTAGGVLSTRARLAVAAGDPRIVPA